MEVRCMRGQRTPQLTMLAFIDLEERVATTHPLRTIKRLSDEALAELSPTFDSKYAEGGRPGPRAGPARGDGPKPQWQPDLTGQDRRRAGQPTPVFPLARHADYPRQPATNGSTGPRAVTG